MMVGLRENSAWLLHALLSAARDAATVAAASGSSFSHTPQVSKFTFYLSKFWRHCSRHGFDSTSRVWLVSVSPSDLLGRLRHRIPVGPPLLRKSPTLAGAHRDAPAGGAERGADGPQNDR